MERAELVSNLQEYKAQLDQVLLHSAQSVSRLMETSLLSSDHDPFVV